MVKKLYICILKNPKTISSSESGTNLFALPNEEIG